MELIFWPDLVGPYTGSWPDAAEREKAAGKKLVIGFDLTLNGSVRTLTTPPRRS
jgi:hypothetical protein